MSSVCHQEGQYFLFVSPTLTLHCERKVGTFNLSKWCIWMILETDLQWAILNFMALCLRNETLEKLMYGAVLWFPIKHSKNAFSQLWFLFKFNTFLFIFKHHVCLFSVKLNFLLHIYFPGGLFGAEIKIFDFGHGWTACNKLVLWYYEICKILSLYYARSWHGPYPLSGKSENR